MTHVQAREILQASTASITVDEDDGTATVNGTLNIEELQAILQLLEYTA